MEIDFVRERVFLGEVRVLHIPMTPQYVYIFTKGFSTSSSRKFAPVSTSTLPPVDTAEGYYNDIILAITVFQSQSLLDLIVDIYLHVLL